MEIRPTLFSLALALIQPAASLASADHNVGPRAAAYTHAHPVVQDDLFPAASGALEISIDDQGEGPSYLELAAQYGELTNQHVAFSPQTKAHLSVARVQLDRSLVAPAAEVQQTFEVMLRQANFSLAIESAAGPRVVRIRSHQTDERNELKEIGQLITADQLEIARRHPAMQFHLVLDLPDTDVRQLSNSLRSMITDPSCSMLLPGGSGSSMIVCGFGDWVHEKAKMLTMLDSMWERTFASRRRLVVALSEAKAEEVAEALGALENSAAPPTQQVWIGVDDQTNSVLIDAPKTRVEAIQKLVEALDR